jgi:hypothetical protein
MANKTNYVVLPDGEIGTIDQADLFANMDAEIEVLQAHKTFGCGPWLFRRSQVVLVTEGWAKRAMAVAA